MTSKTLAELALKVRGVMMVVSALAGTPGALMAGLSMSGADSQTAAWRAMQIGGVLNIVSYGCAGLALIVFTKGFLLRVFSCFRDFVVPIALLTSVIWCTSCVDRARVNVDCRWVHETKASALDMGSRANREHLADDALFAEDLAIRYADAQHGHRSGHYKGIDEYERARQLCMRAMFDTIAKDHRVTRADVAAGLEHRRADFDATTILVFFILYALAATAVAQWMFRTFVFERAFALVVTAAVSAPVAVLGWVAGGLWSSAFEMIRIGNDHLSYRGGRAPWSRHPAAAFAACVAVFWLASVWRYRAQRQEESRWEQSAYPN